MSNAVFPTLAGITWNVLKTPGWSTKVLRSVGGKEQRASFWSAPIYTWQLTYELLRANALLELQTLVGFFNARQGKFDSFLFSDPSDNAVTAHGFGVGNGSTTAFQLQRTIAAGAPRQGDPISGSIAMLTVPRSNYLIFSEQLDNAAWTKRGTATVAPNSYVAPDGTLTADAVLSIDSAAVGDFFQSVTGLVPSTRYEPSFFIIGPGGTAVLGIQNPVGTGRWTLNLALLGAGWERITRSHKAVTVVNEFVSTAGGGCGLHIFKDSGAGVTSGYFWGHQLDQGTLSTPYTRTTTTALSVIPAYWPASGDAFEPVFDLNYVGSIPQVQIYVNGVLKTYGTDYTIGATGVVTFVAAPAGGTILTWTGSYFWRVRFDLDQAEFNNFMYQLWEAKRVTLVSVK